MADTTTRTPRRRLRLSLVPLRSRDYRLLFVAESVSVFGDAFHAVALPFLVYQAGGGARELGLLVAGYGLCRLATTPLGGILADRVGPWQVMLASDLLRLASTAAIAVAAVAGDPGLVPIGALVAVAGLGAGLFQPAAYAITPRLLPADQLQAGNALHSTAGFAAGLVGPGVAGLVVVLLSPGVAFGVDALTFAVSAACLAAIGAHHRRAAPVARPADGTASPPRLTFWQLLRGSPLLRTVLVVTAAANLTVGGMVRVGLPSLASAELAAGAGGFGGLLAAFTGGSLAGGFFTAALTGIRRRGATAMLAGLVMAGAVALVPFTGYAGALVALAVAGVASTVTNVLVVTVVQQHTAAHLLGRVMSAILFAALSLFPLSGAAAGLVVDAYGSGVLFLATSATLGAAFAFGLSRRALRDG
ncbi:MULTISPECIES: MFS transporter [unclassified Micromonospora]|uniref:MFS transporter n=1 Tax=unclassified Micromonospora TaxID=2617518 RepID=UPI00363D66E7